MVESVWLRLCVCVCMGTGVRCPVVPSGCWVGAQIQKMLLHQNQKKNAPKRNRSSSSRLCIRSRLAVCIGAWCASLNKAQARCAAAVSACHQWIAGRSRRTPPSRDPAASTSRGRRMRTAARTRRTTAPRNPRTAPGCGRVSIPCIAVHGTRRRLRGWACAKCASGARPRALFASQAPPFARTDGRAGGPTSHGDLAARMGATALCQARVPW